MQFWATFFLSWLMEILNFYFPEWSLVKPLVKFWVLENAANSFVNGLTDSFPITVPYGDVKLSTKNKFCSYKLNIRTAISLRLRSILSPIIKGLIPMG